MLIVHGVSAVKLFIQWLQLGPIKLARVQQSCVLKIVAWVRLVDWIEADNVRVVGEAFAGDVPEVDKLVLKAVFIVVQSRKCGQGFGRVVIVREVLGLTLTNERLAIFVESIAPALDGLTEV